MHADVWRVWSLSGWGLVTAGSDQHMVRGRTSLPGGYMVLGHEITGEVIEGTG
jgi:hypothetical protein